MRTKGATVLPALLQPLTVSSFTSQSPDDEMYAVHPCPADLRTTLEADNSAISNYIPSTSPSPSPSPTLPHTFFPSEVVFSLPPTISEYHSHFE
ncbi:uncharacterized protein F5147DRAFT_777844 [Suillus discolor]|uniref:Uncharacterized protein n=1 Tax=Suillus discolor TaxID=1912936 RepID=A0A9P7F0D2_9AGAM|nr:uncharacterized protein F5147DRAFT_777844 [Suillus discolor]KAG2097981.1 hypothetical protein F5147DRAFT_777844 [Suillus discolor]